MAKDYPNSALRMNAMRRIRDEIEGRINNSKGKFNSDDVTEYFYFSDHRMEGVVKDIFEHPEKYDKSLVGDLQQSLVMAYGNANRSGYKEKAERLAKVLMGFIEKGTDCCLFNYYDRILCYDEEEYPTSQLRLNTLRRLKELNDPNAKQENRDYIRDELKKLEDTLAAPDKSRSTSGDGDKRGE